MSPLHIILSQSRSLTNDKGIDNIQLNSTQFRKIFSLTKDGVMKPFHRIIKELTGWDVIPASKARVGHNELLSILESVANRAAQEVIDNSIVQDRPNEAGNNIEDYVEDALREEITIEIRDMRQKSGYPDIKSQIAATREVVFIECKIFNSKTRDSTQRTFYLSDGPAIREKVDCDAIHVAISYEMNQTGKEYRPHAYKIIDLYDLPCKLKKEWNSNNRYLYDDCRVLASRSL